MFFIHIYAFIYINVCKHFACLFAPWRQDVNLAFNKTFRSRPECLSNVLCTFRLLFQRQVHISSFDS